MACHPWKKNSTKQKNQANPTKQPKTPQVFSRKQSIRLVFGMQSFAERGVR